VYRQTGPGGPPLVLRLSEGLGPTARRWTLGLQILTTSFIQDGSYELHEHFVLKLGLFLGLMKFHLLLSLTVRIQQLRYKYSIDSHSLKV
jgi:hypothetical protein